VRTATSFRAAGDITRVLVGQVRLCTDGACGCGFAECSGVAKTLAPAELRRVVEQGVLADVALRVEKQYFGVPQLGEADKGDDHGGGGLFLLVLGGGKPSEYLSHLHSWIQHLDLFTSVIRPGVCGDPVYPVAGPSLANMRRNGRDHRQSIEDNAEKWHVVATTFAGASSENQCFRSGDVGGVERRDSDVGVYHQVLVHGAEGGIGAFLGIGGYLTKLDNNAAFDRRGRFDAFSWSFWEPRDSRHRRSQQEWQRRLSCERQRLFSFQSFNLSVTFSGGK
jgi:hypothetical protein